MAAKKRKQYKGPPAGGAGGENPNKVLIIFLVFFVLLSGGLGYMTYEGFNAQKKGEDAAKEAKDAKAATDNTNEFLRYYTLEMRSMVDPKLIEEKEDVLLKAGRKKLADGGFKDEAGADNLKKAVQDAVKDLGLNTAKTDYNKDYKKVFVEEKTDKEAKIQALQKQLDDERDNGAKQITALAKLKADFKKLEDDTFAKLDEISKDSVKTTKQAEKLIAEKAELVQLRTDDLAKYDEKLREKATELFGWITKYNKLQEQVQVVGGGAVGKKFDGSGGQVHALILDVSQGKPLWDQPRGKIIRVDPEARKVYINLGSNHGVEKFLTFNVFAASSDGAASGRMRGTIEVQTVIDANTSMGMITSLYDVNGFPISLYDSNRGASLRMGDNPMKDGDLLFNPLWKTHVALAGRFRFFDHNAVSATEEMRQVHQLISLLRKHGIIVDSYLDLMDGQIKGKITQDTQYLVFGYEAEEEKKQLGVEPTVDPKAINEKIQEMKGEAVANGMFIISAKNFGNILGYRPTQSSTDSFVTDFRPTVPAVGNLPIREQPLGGNK
jgi:hypothetical protein